MKKETILEIIQLRLKAAKATLAECNTDEPSQMSYSRGQVAAYEELIDRIMRDPTE